MCCLHPHSKQNNKIFRRSDVLLLSGSLEYVKYSIRFQVIKLKLLCEALKNEKFLLDIQTKRGNIASEMLNALIDV